MSGLKFEISKETEEFIENQEVETRPFGERLGDAFQLTSVPSAIDLLAKQHKADPDFIWSESKKSKYLSGLSIDAQIEVSKARSDEEAQERREQAIENEQRKKRLEEDGFVDSIVPSIVAGLAEPLNYIPFAGAAVKGGVLAKGAAIGAGAASTGLIANSVDYAANHTTTETDLAIGVATDFLLGSSLGVLGASLSNKLGKTIEDDSKGSYGASEELESPEQQTSVGASSNSWLNVESEDVTEINDIIYESLQSDKYKAIESSELEALVEVKVNQIKGFDKLDEEAKAFERQKAEESILDGLTKVGFQSKAEKALLALDRSRAANLIRDVHRGENLAAEYVVKNVLNDSTGGANGAGGATVEAIKRNVEAKLLTKALKAQEGYDNLSDKHKEFFKVYRNNLRDGFDVSMEALDTELIGGNKEVYDTLVELNKDFDVAYSELLKLKKESNVYGFGSVEFKSGYGARIVDRKAFESIGEDQELRQGYIDLLANSMKASLLREKELAKDKEGWDKTKRGSIVNRLLSKESGKMKGDEGIKTLAKIRLESMDVNRKNPKGESIRLVMSEHESFQLQQDSLKKYGKEHGLEKEMAEIIEMNKAQFELMNKEGLKSDRAKQRTNMDLSQKLKLKDGTVISLNDLYVKDEGALLDFAIKEGAGQIAFGSKGISGRADWNKLSKSYEASLREQGIAGDKLAKKLIEFDDIYEMVTGRPPSRVESASNATNAGIRRTKETINANMLGMAGASQFADIGIMLPTTKLKTLKNLYKAFSVMNHGKNRIGIKSFGLDLGDFKSRFKDFDETKSSSDPVANSILSTLEFGNEFRTNKPSTQRFLEGDRLQNRISKRNKKQMNLVEKKYQKLTGGRTTGEMFDDFMTPVSNILYHVNGQNVLTSLTQTTTAASYASHLIGSIFKEGFKITKRMRSDGVNTDFVEAIRKAREDGHITLNENGNIVLFKFRSLPEELQETIKTIVRARSSHTIISSDVASSMAWTENPVMRLATALLKFVLMSYPKLLLREISMRDASSAAVIITSTLFATAAAYIKLQILGSIVDAAKGKEQERDFGEIMDDEARFAMVVGGNVGALALPFFVYEAIATNPITQELFIELTGEAPYTSKDAFFGNARAGRIGGQSFIDSLPISGFANRLTEGTESLASGIIQRDFEGEGEAIMKSLPLQNSPLGQAARGGISIIEKVKDL